MGGLTNDLADQLARISATAPIPPPSLSPSHRLPQPLPAAAYTTNIQSIIPAGGCILNPPPAGGSSSMNSPSTTTADHYYNAANAGAIPHESSVDPNMARPLIIISPFQDFLERNWLRYLVDLIGGSTDFSAALALAAGNLKATTTTDTQYAELVTRAHRDWADISDSDRREYVARYDEAELMRVEKAERDRVEQMFRGFESLNCN